MLGIPDRSSCNPDAHRILRGARRRSRPSGRKTAHRGLWPSAKPASRPTRSQVPNVSGENSRCCTMPRRTPLLQQGNQHTSSCPSGGLASFANSLVRTGNSVTSFGNVTSTVGNTAAVDGIVVSAFGAPEVGAPVAALGIAVSGAGTLVSYAGIGLQAAGGLILNQLGNSQPGRSALLQIGAASVDAGIDAVNDRLGVPSPPLPSPLDPVVDRLAGENPCP